MNYNFDTVIDRSHTGSLKWDKYKNKDVIPMWVADMDFVSAPEIIDFMKKRVEHGVFGYTVPYDSVIEAVTQYLANTHNYTIKEEWIVWLPGLVPGLNVASAAFGNVGDSIMTATPVYPPFLTAPTNRNRTLITNPLVWNGERYTFDWESMEQSVTKDTQLFILCNPHNPIGQTYTEAELRKLADFCERHNLVLCSDEIHCDLILEPNLKHICTATLDKKIAERTITLMAPSKTYNIPGLSCSFAIIENPEIRAPFKKAANGYITEINALGYAGCEAAYRFGEAWRKQLINYLRTNRDVLYSFLQSNIPQIKMKPMQATYLAWMDISALNINHPASYFESKSVGLSDGAYFGNKNFLRLNFGCPRSILNEGLQGMLAAVNSIS